MWRGVLANFTLAVGALAGIVLFAFFMSFWRILGIEAAARFVPGMAAALLMMLGAAEAELGGGHAPRVMAAGWIALAGAVACAAW